MKSLALLLLLAGRAAAQSYAGSEAFEFLLHDGGGRAAALGGAYTALARDAHALRYNPAGLGGLASNEASFMHHAAVAGLSQDYAAAGLTSGLGALLNYQSLGQIKRTTTDQPSGSGSTFGLSDLELGVGYGRSFGRLSAGAAVKYLREELDDATAHGAAFDAGVLYVPESLPGLSFGAAVLHLGPDVRFLNRRERLPATIRAGAAYSFSAAGLSHAAAVDLSRARADRVRVGAGLESVLLGAVALRLGFTTRDDAGIGITGGLGVSLKALSLDYAVAPHGDLGYGHRASVTLRWGARAPEAAEPAAAPVPAPEDSRRMAALLRAGDLALRQGALARARERYEECVQIATTRGISEPAVADCYAGMGYATQDEITGLALDYFRKALEIGPSAGKRAAVERAAKALQKKLGR